MLCDAGIVIVMTHYAVSGMRNDRTMVNVEECEAQISNRSDAKWLCSHTCDRGCAPVCMELLKQGEHHAAIMFSTCDIIVGQL